jgi:hypothetical protein
MCCTKHYETTFLVVKFDSAKSVLTIQSQNIFKDEMLAFHLFGQKSHAQSSGPKLPCLEKKKCLKSNNTSSS